MVRGRKELEVLVKLNVDAVTHAEFNSTDCTNTQARANPALAFEKYSQFGYNVIVGFM